MQAWILPGQQRPGPAVPDLLRGGSLPELGRNSSSLGVRDAAVVILQSHTMYMRYLVLYTPALYLSVIQCIWTTQCISTHQVVALRETRSLREAEGFLFCSLALPSGSRGWGSDASWLMA